MAYNRTLNRNLSARRGKLEPEPEPAPPVEVKVNFGESDERYGYIRSKLDDIMQGIGQSYSDRLTKELIHRLEKTILEFHTEVISILEKLENLEEKREKAKTPEPAEEPEITAEPVEAEISDWEKRLEEREHRQEKPESKPDTPKEEKKEGKKGLFHRKK
ncbi:MAG: hypothetical protein M0R34_01270 [Candidatus Marinimicrobia bacterium]|nr:hypothetical protein [Candidatus Neomarinimicrobiota bacterium]